MQLNKTALGLALGVISAIWAILTALTAAYFNWGTEVVKLVSDIYIGYSASITGAIIGGIWAFVDGFVCGFIFAWLYNKFSGRS